MMDPNGLIAERYFREKCVFRKNMLIKDLSKLGRSPKSIILIDNSPASYILQPDNAIPIPTWINDPNDSELSKLIPILQLLSQVNDVRPHIHKIAKNNVILFSYAFDYLKSEVEYAERNLASHSVIKPEFSTSKSNRLIIRADEKSNVSNFQCKLKYSNEMPNSTNNTNDLQEAAHNCTPIFKKTNKVRIVANNVKMNELSPNKLESPKSPNYFTNLLKIKKNLTTSRFIGRNTAECKFSLDARKWKEYYDTLKRKDIQKYTCQSKSPRPTTMQTLQKSTSQLRPPTGKTLFHTNFLVSGTNLYTSPSITNIKVRSLLY